MPNLAANLTMMFNEVEFLQRFDAAADAGFKGVEALFPYGYDKNQLSDILNNRNLELVLHNLPPGDWDAGERGIACISDRVGEFQDGYRICYESQLQATKLSIWYSAGISE